MFVTGGEKVLSSCTRIGLFADEVVLWSCDTDIKEVELRFNYNLKAAKLKLCFNPAKLIVTF